MPYAYITAMFFTISIVQGTVPEPASFETAYIWDQTTLPSRPFGAFGTTDWQGEIDGGYFSVAHIRIGDGTLPTVFFDPNSSLGMTKGHDGGFTHFTIEANTDATFANASLYIDDDPAVAHITDQIRLRTMPGCSVSWFQYGLEGVVGLLQGAVDFTFCTFFDCGEFNGGEYQDCNFVLCDGLVVDNAGVINGCSFVDVENPITVTQGGFHFMSGNTFSNSGDVDFVNDSGVTVILFVTGDLPTVSNTGNGTTYVIPQ